MAAITATDVASGVVPGNPNMNNGTAVVSINGRLAKTYTGNAVIRDIGSETKVLFDRKNLKFDDPTFYTA